MAKEFRIMGNKNTELYCYKDETNTPRCVVIIVHGFAEHLGRYNYLAQKLADSGCIVYRFDNRGHGKSGGKQMDLENYEDLIQDADVVVNKAKAENPKLPVFMLGHSMGGFITAAYGVKYPNKLAGQILSGAATDTPQQMNKFLALAVKIGNRIVPNLRIKTDLSSMLCTDPKVVNEYRNDRLVYGKTTIRFYYEFMIKGIEWLKTNMSEYKYPCLVLHGANDKIIDCKKSQCFIDKISSSDKKLIIFDNMYHEIFNEFEKDKVIENVISWILERI